MKMDEIVTQTPTGWSLAGMALTFVLVPVVFGLVVYALSVGGFKSRIFGVLTGVLCGIAAVCLIIAVNVFPWSPHHIGSIKGAAGAVEQVLGVDVSPDQVHVAEYPDMFTYQGVGGVQCTVIAQGERTQWVWNLMPYEAVDYQVSCSMPQA